VDLAGLSGALFGASERPVGQYSRLSNNGPSIHPRERIASAHGRAEGLAAAEQLIMAGQMLERPPSRQKPPPEALHLFQESHARLLTATRHTSSTIQQRPMTSQVCASAASPRHVSAAAETRSVRGYATG